MVCISSLISRLNFGSTWALCFVEFFQVEKTKHEDICGYIIKKSSVDFIFIYLFKKKERKNIKSKSHVTFKLKKINIKKNFTKRILLLIF